MYCSGDQSDFKFQLEPVDGGGSGSGGDGGGGVRENFELLGKGGYSTNSQTIPQNMMLPRRPEDGLYRRESPFLGGDCIAFVAGQSYQKDKNMLVPSIFSNKAKGNTGISYVLNFNILQWKCS